MQHTAKKPAQRGRMPTIPDTQYAATCPTVRASAPHPYPWLNPAPPQIDPPVDDGTFAFDGCDEPPAAAKPAAPEVCPALTAAVVAALFGVTTRTIRNWIKRGLLVPIRIGRTIRFSGTDIERLLRIKIDKNSVQNE